MNESSPIEPNLSDGRDGSMCYYRGDGFWPKKREVWSLNYSAESRGTKLLPDLGLLLWRISKVEEPEKTSTDRSRSLCALSDLLLKPSDSLSAN